MSIYNNIRKKAAQKVSNLNEAEIFSWNKWLRIPSNEGKEIKKLFSDLKNTENIILAFGVPTNNYFDPKISKVKSIKSSSKAFKIRSRTNPIFFQFGITKPINYDISYKQELRHFFSAEVINNKSSVQLKINSSKQKEILKQLSSQSISFPFSISYSDKSLSTKNIFNEKSGIDISAAPIKDFSTEIFTYKIAEIEYSISIPDIIDYLHRLIPKIYKINLLNSFEEIISSKKDYQIKIDLLESEPQIHTKNNIGLVLAELIPTLFQNKINVRLDEKNYLEKITPFNNYNIKSYFPEFLGQQEISFSMFYNSDSTQPILTRNYNSEWIEELNNNLQPVINLSIEEENEIFKNLFPYQIEGAKFLIENPLACLADEIGLGKTLEVISAIKYLFKKKEIKNILIISQKYQIHEKGYNHKIGAVCGWEAHFQKFASDIKTTIINSNSSEINSELRKTAQVYFVSYELLFESLVTNALDFNSIKKFDCICFDDAEILINNSNNFEKLFKLSNSKFTWLISNQPEFIFNDKTLLKISSAASLRRNKNNISNQIPQIIQEEFWIDLNNEQRLEYNQAYVEAQTQIWNGMQTGNPYRLQAIVFTHLHKLKQITNYSSQKITSNKTDLLFLQLNSIKNFNHKALVISQYDKFGTQRLIEFFKQNDIKYFSFLPNASQNEVQQSIIKFREDKSITVFLTSSKDSLNLIQQINVNYVIYFDQWWIPVGGWQLEEKIKQQNEKVHIISYFAKDTIEEKIREKLLEKDLLSKENVGNIGADAYSKLLNEKDWLEVFNVPFQPPEKDKPSDETNSDEE